MINRSTKVTKKRFLQVLRDQEDLKSNSELAEEFGVSIATLYRYKIRYREEIQKEAKTLAMSLAIEMVQQLARNARNNDTTAAIKLLEIGQVYIPRREINADIKATGRVIQLPVRDFDKPADNGEPESDQDKLKPATREPDTYNRQ